MGTSKYLDSVLRVLPAIQAKQIFDLLTKLQVSGQIKNSSEYQNKLTELTALINSSLPAPSFNRIKAIVWNLCSSDLQNTMLLSARNDIEALFVQTDEIGQKLSDHNILFMEGVISDLAKVINEQEETITRLEWLSSSNNEFTSAISNTFSSSILGKTQRNETIASSLYFDNRTYINKPKEELPDAFVSEKGSKLILSAQNDSVVVPISIKEHNTSSSSEFTVDTNTSIENIIDGQRGTFWTKNIYISSPVPKVSTVIELNLGSSKDINYMIIETGMTESFIIEKLIGKTYDGSQLELLSLPLTVNGTTRVDFIKSNISSIFITISTSTYKKSEYYIPSDSSIHDALDKSNKFNKLLQREAIEPAVIKSLSSDNLASFIGIDTPIEKQINQYSYTFIIDNIWFGNSEYQNTGLFVSKPFKITNIGLLGLNVDEKEETGILKNTIEYDIVKIDRWPRYNEQRFPILPLGKLDIDCERLILTKRTSDSNYINNVGSLRFCPHVMSGWSIEDPAPVMVYKNGSLLVIGADWEFAISKNNTDFEWTSSFAFASYFNNYTLTPPKMWIKIRNPEESAVYTVSYKARSSDAYSDDVSLWLTENQLVYMDREGKIYFRQENPSIDIESEIYLQITLRRNLASAASTPELNDYVLLGASYTR
jgi:hypothetical protein